MKRPSGAELRSLPKANQKFELRRRGAAPNPRCRAKRIIPAPVGRFVPQRIKMQPKTFLDRGRQSPTDKIKKERLAPLLNDELANVKRTFLKRRERSSEEKPPLLAETIYDYSQSLFENAIAFVEQQP